MSTDTDHQFKDIIVRNSKPYQILMSIWVLVLLIIIGYQIWVQGYDSTNNKIGFGLLIIGLAYTVWQYFNRKPSFIITKTGIVFKKKLYSWEIIEQVKCRAVSSADSATHHYLIITFTDDCIHEKKLKIKNKEMHISIHGVDHSFGQIQYYSAYYKAIDDKQREHSKAKNISEILNTLNQNKLVK